MTCDLQSYVIPNSLYVVKSHGYIPSSLHQKTSDFIEIHREQYNHEPLKNTEFSIAGCRKENQGSSKFEKNLPVYCCLED